MLRRQRHMEGFPQQRRDRKVGPPLAIPQESTSIAPSASAPNCSEVHISRSRTSTRGSTRRKAWIAIGSSVNMTDPGETHGQLALLAAGYAPRLLQVICQPCHGCRGTLAQHRARGRQVTPRVVLLNNCSFQDLFQPWDLLAQRGLGHPQLRGGTAKMQRLRNREEVAEMPECN